MSRNDITGDAIKTKAPSKEYDEGWDRIFGNKDVLCKVCGLNPKEKLECFYTACPKNFEET